MWHCFKVNDKCSSNTRRCNIYINIYIYIQMFSDFYAADKQVRNKSMLLHIINLFSGRTLITFHWITNCCYQLFRGFHAFFLIRSLSSSDALLMNMFWPIVITSFQPDFKRVLCLQFSIFFFSCIIISFLFN